ncbi:hypothetical protein ACJIZ3_013618 [Penstemon smallii]|uniref:Uncharacterized protein n=1 Tax=Penstemon smallii TaxID=265156 RepID=A0ABD3RHE5_9LAMI
MVGAPISSSANHAGPINPTVNNLGTPELYAPPPGPPPHQMYGISSLLPYNGQATGPPNMPTPNSAAYPGAPPPPFPPCSTVPPNFNYSTNNNYPHATSSPISAYQLPANYHSAHQSPSAYLPAGYPPQPNNPQGLGGYHDQGHYPPPPPNQISTQKPDYIGNLYPTPPANSGVYPTNTSTGGVYPHQY